MSNYYYYTPIALTEKISTAIGRNICALIPPRINNSTIIAVWPKSLNDSIVGSSDNDHICPLCNTTECHLLRCSGINETEYRVTLNSTEQGDALCVNNAVEEMNNLYFQFYIEESRCYEYSSTSFGLSISSTINRLYLNSYYIRIGNNNDCYTILNSCIIINTIMFRTSFHSICTC